MRKGLGYVDERIEIVEQRDFAMASVMARTGIEPRRIGAALGGSIPDGPHWRQVEGACMIGVGPANWLAFTANAGRDWEVRLRRRLEGLASISDQSSAYAVFRLSSSGARAALQRGLQIDMDPRHFVPGSAAVSVISHIGVVVWQIDDVPTYHIACFRSHATSFCDWLEKSIASGVFT